ncbi:MAG: ankyrin repeat domain-containing protein [Verrucomicrobiota bacterium]|nr:ankyrin repeat domain-containing protein [Verrucomicrobiota bacterium]
MNNINFSQIQGIRSALSEFSPQSYSLEKIKEAVAAGKLDINKTDDAGRNLLLMAAFYRRFDVVKWLIEVKGANINQTDKFGYTVLLLATEVNHLPMVQWLVAKRQEKEETAPREAEVVEITSCVPVPQIFTAVMSCALGDSTKKRTPLTEERRSVKTTTQEQKACSDAILHDFRALADWFLEKELVTPSELWIDLLNDLGVQGNLEAIKHWIEDKKVIDISFVGKGLLQRAIANSHLELARWLVLKKGVRIDKLGLRDEQELANVKEWIGGR